MDISVEMRLKVINDELRYLRSVSPSKYLAAEKSLCQKYLPLKTFPPKNIAPRINIVNFQASNIIQLTFFHF